MKTYKFSVSKYFTQDTTLGEVLLVPTKLKREVLADAAAKGAVWIQRAGKGKTLRIRSLEEKVKPSDVISFFYDTRVLSLPTVNSAECIFENNHYGIWVKAPGVVPQGSQSSDHASLLRFIETEKKKEVFLIHRIDRETEGLMIFGYSPEAARKLSELFQKHLIKKTYQAIVVGHMKEGSEATINASLDDKEAITHYKVLTSTKDSSLLEVNIETGRLHQIRRHLDLIGHPILGDPKYGRGNKNKEGLKLIAKSLEFKDPWNKSQKFFQLNTSLEI